MPKKFNIFYKLLKIFFLTGNLILLGVLIHNYFDKIKLFNDVNLIIKDNDFINSKEIEKQIDPFMNKSLLQLDIKKIKDNILKIKFIHSVQVSRVLPNTLLLQILERKPMLLINLKGQTSFIDKEGMLISSQINSINYFPVPSVTINENVNNIDSIRTVIHELFSKITTKYPTFYDDLSEVIIENKKWIFFCDNKTQIITKSNEIFSQLYILKYFEKTVFPNREIKDYSYIDLRFDEHVIVKEKYRKS